MARKFSPPPLTLRIPVHIWPRDGASDAVHEVSIDPEPLLRELLAGEFGQENLPPEADVYRRGTVDAWLEENRREERITRFGPKWGLIVPRSEEGLHIRKSLAALINHRGGKTTLDFDPLTQSHNPTSDITAWIDAHEAQLDELDCILIAGPPSVIPLQLDQLLAIRKFVGRLGFDVDLTRVQTCPYLCYAHKLVKAEEADSIPRGGVVFHSVWTEKDAVTLQLYRRFTAPVLAALDIDTFEQLEAQAPSPASPAESPDSVRVGTQPSWDQRPLFGSRDHRALKRVLSQASPHPSLLVATCHGGEWPQDPTSPNQGALMDASGSGTPGQFDSECVDTQKGAILPDGIAILYACNSAGTPKHRPWIQLMKEPPFPTCPKHDHISTLAQALLKRTDGPLALIGHVDVAFLWGLADRTGNFEPPARDLLGQHYRDVVKSLLAGNPVADALSPVHLRANYLRASLLSRLFAHRPQGASTLDLGIQASRTPDPVPLDPEEAHLQKVALCQYLDATGWIVLGDPLATLEGRAGRTSAT